MMDNQDASAKQIEKSSGSESLVATFHRVKSLIPGGQKLMTIPPEMPVTKALELMQNNCPSLPVMPF
jgi:hypothetical protein